jgi:uncharacterized protein YjiS (DUF1127 family)
MMMTIESSLAAPNCRIRTGAPFGLLVGLVELIEVWRSRRAWRVDLRRLDDHMLRDIGLERADAEIEIAKPFWRR